MTTTKDVDYYMALPYRVVITPDEDGGFNAYILELTGCVAHEDTIDQLYEIITDVQRNWIEIALEDGWDIPEPPSDESKQYSGKFLLRLPRYLHRELAQEADAEDTSLNQLAVALLSEGLERRRQNRQKLQRMYRRQAKNERRTMDFTQLAQEIADALGWTVEPTDEPKPYITLRGRGNEELYLRLDSGRVRISGEYPRLYDQYRVVQWCLPYGEHGPSITCAMDRGAEAIADDIQRRLLPEYRELLEKVQAAIVTQMMRNEATKAVADCLLEVLPPNTHVRRNEREQWEYELQPNGCIYQITVQGTDDPQGSVDIEIRRATDKVAQEVCRLITEAERERP